MNNIRVNRVKVSGNRCPPINTIGIIDRGNNASMCEGCIAIRILIHIPIKSMTCNKMRVCTLSL